MGKRIDLTGQRFGRLVVISLNEEVSKQKKATYWNCRCDCGNESLVRVDSLKSGRSTSCGCYNSELISKKLKEKWQNKEFKQMKSNEMRDMVKEKWKDEDFRQKQSNKAKEQWKNKDFRQMEMDKIKEKWQDEEFRQKQSNGTKEKWKDETFRQKQSNKIKEMWDDEETKWKFNYKGGITPISIHLKGLNEKWFRNSKQQANYTCELTGKVGKKLHTHHLKAFSTIIFEAHELNNIEIKPQVKDYTQEELHKLEEYVASWHKDNSNAVVLCEEVHMLFHNLYGKGGNTPEQFEEFKQRFLDGEFKEIIK